MTFPTPAERADWFSSQYEAFLPDDEQERADYLRDLDTWAIHGPAAGEEATA